MPRTPAALSLVFALGACETTTPPPEAPTFSAGPSCAVGEEPPADEPAAMAPEEVVAYSCDFVDLGGQRRALAREPQAGEIPALLHALEKGERPHEVAVLAAFLGALRQDPDALRVEERIAVQSATLLLLHLGHEYSAGTRRIGQALAQRLALPGAVLEALGSDPAVGVAHVVGPMAAWKERRGPSCGNGPLAHEAVYGGLLAFRPIGAGGLRALIAQSVAFDTDGLPHLTPVIAYVRIRGGGAGHPACVLGFDVASLHEGAPAGLRALAYDELPRDPFTIRHGGGVRCNACHRPDGAHPTFEDVPAADVDTLLRARREVLLAHVKEVAATRR